MAIGYERHGVGALDPWKTCRCKKCNEEIEYMYGKPDLCNDCEEELLAKDLEDSFEELLDEK